MNGWFPHCAAAPIFTMTQHFRRCERKQHENQIHGMGSPDTFAANCTKVRSERTRRGQSGLKHARLLLMQHFLAVAVDLMLRCSLSRGSGHSILSISVDFKPTFRRILQQLVECGTKQ
ncbi:hypothetical protein A9Q95_15660 [Rhodobacterales bacterium 59_46_T64]|nr:hypothetical protein A9Q95_15660 [Rhodobacterales bacterium 59_46_T64]